ncbi:ABC transporter ATP-binding protein [Paenibacillus durus]|uniref:ABC transporter ATP-binding protein n=1 Tax=Paenibacillus durus TaxID=44251 RepID=UPI00069398DD|nr:ABC transporter ATP-binding protein [Paenibacillus durus]
MELVRIESLTKNYGNLTALDNVSFEIKRGEIVGYLGPNGSGKTTTLQAITDLISIDEGNVYINQKNIASNKEKNISAVFDANGLYPRLTVQENLEFFTRLKGVGKKKGNELIDYFLSEFQLESRRNSIVKSLSKGMQRKLAIARALLFKPELLLLDEPFDGIDIESRDKIIKLIKKISKESQIAVFLTSHVMADIEELADKIIIINGGRIIKNDLRDNLLREPKIQCVHVRLAKAYEEKYLSEILAKFIDPQYFSVFPNEIIIKLNEEDADLDIPGLLFENNIKFVEIYNNKQNLTETYLNYIK